MSVSATRGSVLPHYAGIDVLRGLCVLLVVLHHVHLRFTLNHYDVAALLPKPIARVVFWNGYYAVIVFFVISGFLITNLSLRRWTALPQIDIAKFYWMRFARIFPCLLALLAVLSVLHIAGATDYVIDPSKSSLWRASLAAVTFHFNWLEGTRGYLPGSWDVLWSLSIEEAFYLFFPLVCIALRSEMRVLVPILALIAIGPFGRVHNAGTEPWDEYAYLCCMDGIAFGCLAALIHARCVLSLRWLRVMLAVGVAAMLLIVAFRQTTNSLGLIATGLYVTVLEAGAALVLIAFAGGVGERFHARLGLLRAVGRCSYEIYLTHMFVVFTTVALFKAADADLSSVGIWYVAALVASALLGYAVSTGYSAPVNNLIRRATIGPTPLVSSA